MTLANMPQVVVECAFETNPDATPKWQDVSAYCLGFTVTRGRQRELDQIQASTCELKFDNGDRRFDPTYTHSPYYPHVLPMRQIRVSAIWSSVTYYLFTGFVERWPISWDGPTWGSVDVTAVDALASLQQAAIVGDFPAETAGARISRVLTAAAWPSSTPLAGSYWTLGVSQLGTTTIPSYGLPTTVIDSGVAIVIAMSPTAASNLSALQHIQDVATTDRGLFFIDGQGRAVYQGRRYRYNLASAVTFTDNAFSSSRLPYQDLAPDYAVDRIINEALVTPVGGAAQSATNGPSIATYRRRTLPLDILTTSTSEALSRAGFEVFLRGDPHLEFTSLALTPQGNTATWPYALNLNLGDRITVERNPGSTAGIIAETLTHDVFIESVSHAATAKSWTTKFQLSPADVFAGFFELNASHLTSASDALLAY